jgi:hypothetical protein
VATVYAIELRDDIFLATWTIHSIFRFYSLYYFLRAGYVPGLSVKKPTDFPSEVLGFQGPR